VIFGRECNPPDRDDRYEKNWLPALICKAKKAINTGANNWVYLLQECGSQRFDAALWDRRAEKNRPEGRLAAGAAFTA
jgi:hypothetical protein